VEQDSRLAFARLVRELESDTLPDGSLDYPDDVLRQFDFIVASDRPGEFEGAQHEFNNGQMLPR
jgi:histidinol phosphatase-like PHP family hydrolase